VLRARVAFSAGGYAPVAPAMPLLFLESLLRWRPDVLHVHMPNAAALWPALLHLPTPLVVHWHADVQFPESRRPAAALLAVWRRLESLLLRRAAVVIATSQAYLDASPSLAPVRSKCVAIPLGLDETRLPSASDPEHAQAHPAVEFLRAAPGLRVLAVGRLAHYKGLHRLLEAVAAVPGVFLCLAGQGEERAALEAGLSRLGLAGRVFLAGDVPDAALHLCYQACQVLCLPSVSRSEAFGLVLLEAMSRGRACVATAVPGTGMTQVVSHGETGLIVPPDSAEALADALRQLQARPELPERYGQAGRERFVSEYRIARVARRIRAVYDSLAPAAGGGGVGA
jgi:rhamnosyl/mannosyltransferase